MSRLAAISLVLALAVACGRADSGPATDGAGGRPTAGGTEPRRSDADGGRGAAEEKDSSASASASAFTITSTATPTTTTKSTVRAGRKKLRKDLWVIGYYATYLFRRYRPEEVRYDALTHLAVTRVFPDEGGGLVAEFGRGGEAGEALVAELVRRAHEAGARALLVVGGGGARAALAAAATDETRPAFVAELVEFARTRGFDGLDLDWEPLRQGDGEALAALAADLRAAWPDADLTAAAGHLPANREAADEAWARAAESLDRINLMTYGMAEARRGGRSWHSAALFGESSEGYVSIDHSVRGYLAAGVSAGRLGIGIGFFGVCYTPPVDGPRQELGRSTIAAADCSMSYADIARRYFDPAARRWDAEARVPYLALGRATGPNGCGYVSYEDGQSIAERAAYVAERGLGGAIVWAINEGHVRDAPEGERDPLMGALARHFLGR